MNDKKLIAIITNECKMTISKGQEVGGMVCKDGIYHESEMVYDDVKKVVEDIVYHAEVDSKTAKDILGVDCVISKDIKRLYISDLTMYLTERVEEIIRNNIGEYKQLIYNRKDNFVVNIAKKIFGNKVKENVDDEVVSVINEKDFVKVGVQYIKELIKQKKFSTEFGGSIPYSKEINQYDKKTLAALLVSDVCKGSKYNLTCFTDKVEDIENIINTCNMISWGVDFKVNGDTKIDDILFTIQSKLHNVPGNEQIKNYREINLSNMGSNAFNTKGKKESGLMPKEGIRESIDSLEGHIWELISKREDMSNDEYIADATKVLYRFIRIHPFRDGNGRTGRLLFNIILNQKEGLTPIVFPKSSKMEFGKILAQVDKDIYENGGESYLEYLKNPTDVQMDELEKVALIPLSEYVNDLFINNEKYLDEKVKVNEREYFNEATLSNNEDETLNDLSTIQPHDIIF
ncbi:MAG: hypothetical protein A2Y22_03090 [Clostridiales bacterium GWD2_32_59]|nr:MAG: hypothetical protein A2Y22_03090 [Clostridiales bacterium GWD2_32_59]